MSRPICLTIAGSDSGGGAGIQADLKTFSALGTFGTSAITALTAQNTVGVQGVLPTPPDFVIEQIRSVLSAIRVDAIKIGMLGGAELTDALTSYFASEQELLSGLPIVLDPVMVAASGDVLTAANTRDAFVRMFPSVSLITPNLAEASVLTGLPQATSDEDMVAQGQMLRELGAPRVLVKGGHRTDLARDLFVDADGSQHWFDAEFIPTIATHGTGCSLSSAITAFKAHGNDWHQAIGKAKCWLTGALRAGESVEIRRDTTKGHLPVHHFYDFLSLDSPVDSAATNAS